MQQCSLRKLKKFPFLFGGTVCISILWAVGILDHLAELPFEDFKWYPFIDVEEQVRNF